MQKTAELKNLFMQGYFDNKLAELYCRPSEQLGYYRQRVLRVLDGFSAQFHKDGDTAVCLVSAPGRTELGGNHTDHQGGKVLTGSVDLDALCCAAPNGTETVRLFSEGYGEVTVNCQQLSPVPEEKTTTAALVRGVLAKVVEKGYCVSGFDGYITSDVPGGSGLSSSACLEVLLGVVVNELFCGGRLSAVEIAQIGQYAENVYFGKPSGLLDQMGCAVGGVVGIDFSDAACPKAKAVSLDLAKCGYAMCIVDTGADHSDLTDDYAAVPREMRAVAACLGKSVLSQVPEDLFYASLPDLRAQVGDRAVLRAIHYYDDCRRVDKQLGALENGDFARYLTLVNQSGQSSFMYLQNIATYRNSAQQPVASAIAMAEHLLNGEGAVRVHGGGFAGTIQAYVPSHMVSQFQAGMDAFLQDGACRVIYIRPVGGCVLA